MPDRIVKVVLRGEVGGFTASMAAAKTSVVSTASSMTAATKEAEKFRSGLDTLGGQAGKIGVVAAAGLGLATKAAMDWETAWAGVTKTVDGSATELAELEVGLRDLAKTLPATHEEIAGVAEAAGQLGVAREDIVSFTKTMIDLGETTNLTADEAATAIAQMANVMGTSGDEVDNLGSALVALGNDGASTEKQIIEMAQRIAGAGAQIGLAESDVLAFANAAASAGLEVEAGGTAISRVFTEMAKASAQGNANLDRFAAAAGLTADEFSTLFKSAPAEAFAAFTGGLDRINKSGGDVFTTLDQIGLSDVRVSDALLRMASSGDLLTDSLKLGSEAWAENLALTEEAGKRYDTTAAKAQVALNGIRDDAIELGQTALPIVAEISDAVTNVTGIFGGLPDPIKRVTGALLGITAVTGGALWFGSKVVNSVTNTRQALDDLGSSAGKTGKKLSRIGGTAVGILAVGSAVGSLADGIGRIDSANLERALASLTLTGTISADLRTVVDDIGTVTSKWNAIDLGEVVTVGGLFGDTSLDRAADNIDQLDQALANLVETGEEARAAEIVTALRDLAESKGTDPNAVNRQLDAYGLALQNTAAEASKAATETSRTTEEVAALATQSGLAAEQVTRMSDAEIESAEAAREIGREFVGLGEHVDNADVSLRDWIRSLEDQAEALTEFKNNAIEAGKKGLSEGLIAELEAAGPAGALRMRELAGATKDEIERANIAWAKGQKAIADYVAMQVPAKDIDVNTSKAVAKLRGLEALLADIASFDAKTNIAPPTGLFPQIGQADGGTVPGVRFPYGDKVIAALAPGEEVITNRNGEADRFRADRAAGRIPAYANGGTVRGYAAGGTVAGRSYAAAPGVTVYFPTPAQLLSVVKAANTVAAATVRTERSADEIRQHNLDILNTQARILQLRKDLNAVDDKGRRELTGFDRSIAKAELADAKADLVALRNQIARERKEARQAAIAELRDQRAETKSTLTGTADIFARGNRPAGAIAEVNRQIADIAEYGNVVARLKGAGASPALLRQIVAKAESGDFRSAIRLGQALLAQPGSLSQLNSALGTLGAVSAAVAGVTTDPRFMAAGSWNPGSSTVTKVVQVNLGADPSSWLLQTQRIVQHEVAAQLAAAGV